MLVKKIAQWTSIFLLLSGNFSMAVEKTEKTYNELMESSSIKPREREVFFYGNNNPFDQDILYINLNDENFVKDNLTLRSNPKNFIENNFQYIKNKYIKAVEKNDRGGKDLKSDKYLEILNNKLKQMNGEELTKIDDIKKKFFFNYITYSRGDVIGYRFLKDFYKKINQYSNFDDCSGEDCKIDPNCYILNGDSCCSPNFSLDSSILTKCPSIFHILSQQVKSNNVDLKKNLNLQEKFKTKNPFDQYLNENNKKIQELGDSNKQLQKQNRLLNIFQNKNTKQMEQEEKDKCYNVMAGISFSRPFYIQIIKKK
jgi:hypothetical protein